MFGNKTVSAKWRIHIDESSFPKHGNDSVAVKRQYCGRLGKVENCQVGVFLGYTNGSYRTLIDMRLYVPEDWANDPARRAFQEDLRREFQESMEKLTPLLSRIEATDQLIDQVVYKLYSLTDEEVAIVEGDR